MYKRVSRFFYIACNKNYNSSNRNNNLVIKEQEKTDKAQPSYRTEGYNNINDGFIDKKQKLPASLGHSCPYPHLL